MAGHKQSVAYSTPIVTWIRQEIETGNFVADQKLPSEAQLQERFGVSRSVVREALSQLKSEGLVHSQQGRGVFVNARGERRMFSLDMSGATLGDLTSLEHVIELLVAIEVAAAKHAAQRHTAADLKKIRKALIGMEYAIACDQLGDEEDYAFHQAIVDATHNPHFITLNEYLEQHVRRLIRQARSHTAQYHQDLIEDVQAEHQAIVQAIEQRDSDAAAAAAERHLRNAAERLRTYITL
ncbi:MAG: FadR/GntR family transcriptional regulator [Paenalcaligenes sp.]